MDRTYVFDNGGEGCNNNGLMSLIGNLCNKQNLDPAYLMAMMNNGNGFGENGSWLWVFFLFVLMGWGNGGWGGFGNRGGQGEGNFLAGQLANDTGRELLQQAINGNGQAISQLASTLNCDINAIQGALNQLNQAICNVGNQVGLTSQQTINAINQGNCQLGNQLAQCCCSIQDAITRGNYENQISNLNQTNQLTNAINNVATGQERGFASVAYETQSQTCELKNAIAAQTTLINDKFCQLEMREMQNKIDSLRAENQNLRFAESQQAQNNYLISQLQPVARPAYLTCSPYQAQMHPFGFYGYNGYNGGNCGCNNNCGNNCCGGCGC